MIADRRVAAQGFDVPHQAAFHPLSSVLPLACESSRNRTCDTSPGAPQGRVSSKTAWDTSGGRHGHGDKGAACAGDVETPLLSGTGRPRTSSPMAASRHRTAPQARSYRLIRVKGFWGMAAETSAFPSRPPPISNRATARLSPPSPGHRPLDRSMAEQALCSDGEGAASQRHSPTSPGLSVDRYATQPSRIVPPGRRAPGPRGRDRRRPSPPRQLAEPLPCCPLPNRPRHLRIVRIALPQLGNIQPCINPRSCFRRHKQLAPMRPQEARPRIAPGAPPAGPVTIPWRRLPKYLGRRHPPPNDRRPPLLLWSWRSSFSLTSGGGVRASSCGILLPLENMRFCPVCADGLELDPCKDGLYVTRKVATAPRGPPLTHFATSRA